MQPNNSQNDNSETKIKTHRIKDFLGRAAGLLICCFCPWTRLPTKQLHYFCCCCLCAKPKGKSKGD